jgi:hypothetical protein
MTKMKKIIVKERSSDFYASIEGSDETQWGCGKSPVEAVGKLLYSHQKELGIKIEETFGKLITK